MLLYNGKPFADYFFSTDSNCCVWCETEDSARSFCEFMHGEGKSWASGNSYLEMTNWDMYEENTVYFKGGTYGDLEYANSYECMILEMGVDIVFGDDDTDFVDEDPLSTDFSKIDEFLFDFCKNK